MIKRLSVLLVCLIISAGCSGTAPGLGVNNGRLTPCPKSPNCVSSQAGDEKHFIQPIHISGTPQDTKDRLLRILESEPRTKILKNQDNYIRVEFTSFLFRFVDDVEFYFPGTQVNETIVHVRSASRTGYSDLGTNRKRIERIRSQFKKSGSSSN